MTYTQKQDLLDRAGNFGIVAANSSIVDLFSNPHLIGEGTSVLDYCLAMARIQFLQTNLFTERQKLKYRDMLLAEANEHVGYVCSGLHPNTRDALAWMLKAPVCKESFQGTRVATGMRYFRYNSPIGDGSGEDNNEVITVSEEDIYRDYYPFWKAEITRVHGAERLAQLSFFECIEDFMVLHWAWEVLDTRDEV